MSSVTVLNKQKSNMVIHDNTVNKYFGSSINIANNTIIHMSDIVNNILGQEFGPLISNNNQLLAQLIYCAEEEARCCLDTNNINATIGMYYDNSVNPYFYLMCQWAN